MPAPVSTREEDSRRVSEGGSNQNLILFSRGNAISGAASISGRSQFPNPPIAIGITKKKIITKAWAVTITLYNWSDPSKEPGWASSARIRRLNAVPTIAAQIAKMKYNVPMSLWLVE